MLFNTQPHIQFSVDKKSSEQEVSILLASYNGICFIDQQIRSLLEQDYPWIKIIVMDDCSTDGTYEHLVRTYGVDSRFELHKNKVNLGVIKTFEELLTLVKTPYFCFCDQDDIWQKNKISMSISLLESSGSDLVYTDLTVVDQNLEIIAHSMWKYANLFPIKGKDILTFILKSPVTGCTVLARSSIIPKALPFPSVIDMHDRWLAMVACQQNGVAYLRDTTVSYRQHFNNQVGTSSFTIRGWRSRIGKFGGGSVLRYLQLRANSKLRYIEAASAIGAVDSDLSFMRDYYASVSFLRNLILLPKFFLLLMRRARHLGFRNILLEVLMSLISFWKYTVFEVKSINDMRD